MIPFIWYVSLKKMEDSDLSKDSNSCLADSLN
jgi:hypothetical protein